MKAINIDANAKQPTIQAEETYRNIFFRKKKIHVTFKAVSVIVPMKYWEWLEMPDMKVVPDTLSFQLDAWLRAEMNK